MEIDAFWLLDANRRRRRATRVDRLRRDHRLSFPLVGQLHNGADGDIIHRTVWVGNGDLVIMLIARLSVGRRGHRNLTSVRVDLVVPPVDGGLSDRFVAVDTQVKLRACWDVVWLDGAVNLDTWASDFHGVIRLVDVLLLLDHLERCENSIRGTVQVSDSHRDLDAVTSFRVRRRRRGHDTGFVDGDLPALDSVGSAEALRLIFGQVALRDLGVIQNRRSLAHARLRGLQFVFRLVDLAVLALRHDGRDGEVA